jgi:hypothetical protein
MSVCAKLLGLAGITVAALWSFRSCDSERDAVERVAEVEHAQWMAWSKAVAPEVSPERRARWAKYWIPYKDLPEDIKELDRAWARRAIAAARRR